MIDVKITYYFDKIHPLIDNPIFNNHVSSILSHYHSTKNLKYFIDFLGCFIDSPLSWFSFNINSLQNSIKIFVELSHLLIIIIINCDINNIVTLISSFDKIISSEINRINITFVEISFPKNDEINNIYLSIIHALKSLSLPYCLQSRSFIEYSLWNNVCNSFVLFPELYCCTNDESCNLKNFKILFERAYHLIKKNDLNRIMKSKKEIQVYFNESIEEIYSISDPKLFIIAKNDNDIFYFIVIPSVYISKCEFFTGSFYYSHTLNIKIYILE